MRPRILCAIALVLIILAIPAVEWATCGGGGGGGTGGMTAGGPAGPGAGGGSSADTQVYMVPWKLLKPEDPQVVAGMILYWFPSSKEELAKSSLRTSQTLSHYAVQCVSMEVTTLDTPFGRKLPADTKLPIAILANPDGTIIAKAENKDGFLKVDQVEKMVETEFKHREDTVKQEMDDAKNKAKGGDNDGAIKLYRAVVEQKCLFPGKAKDAVNALKKLGVNESVVIPQPMIYDRAIEAQINKIMRQGLRAELDAKYIQAEKLYSQAHEMDPADPVPLRYLGELYRHHIGDWAKARVAFQQILDQPSDPMSRAVALHGLGKMTIHDGEFKKGLALMEESVKTYPLVLAYRNLAVYWNSEGEPAKAAEYVKLALDLAPQDPYNVVFAATFMAASGHNDEALKIAKENESLLSASYNLAAIYAQAGDKEKALALLKRHFFEYERYQSVRSKEMMEARVDAVFLSLRRDPAFVALTNDADGKLDPPRPMTAAPPGSMK
ncbi:MAG TPA: tetratricopeptide repeat protein [Candidatus Acidoferrum sp.]|nr:tetratricopeptide repeat protein [Candidatus Acidoferrum sp.]